MSVHCSQKEENAYWIFSDITADSFHWENVRMKADGEKFLVGEFFCKKLAARADVQLKKK